MKKSKVVLPTEGLKHRKSSGFGLFYELYLLTFELFGLET